MCRNQSTPRYCLTSPEATKFPLTSVSLSTPNITYFSYNNRQHSAQQQQQSANQKNMTMTRDCKQQDNSTESSLSEQINPNTSTASAKHFNNQYTEQRLEKQQNLPYDKITPQMINHESIATNDDMAQQNHQDNLNMLIGEKNYNTHSDDIKCENFVQHSVIRDTAALLSKIEQAKMEMNSQNIKNED